VLVNEYSPEEGILHHTGGFKSPSLST
jgi:hypothetical protein